MEEIKKLFVLLTTIVLIGLVVYFVSIASFQPEDDTEGAPDDTITMDVPIPESPAEDTMGAAAPEEELDKDVAAPSEPRESIAWHHLNNKPQEVGDAAPNAQSLNPNTYFTRAARRILPAVVSIRSTAVMDLIPEDHPRFYLPGSGSGIIISDNGYVLTNYHVINEAKNLRITLYDKREFPANYIGGDPTTDVALLKIEADDLPVAYLGNSEDIEIGEWVLAVGNPLNFRSTITAGIVSAIGRDIRIINEEYRIENFIQTDAVINPGNSGGALVNLDGEVIGVNTAIATRTGLSEGYGFAIPINLARKVVDDIVQFGYVKRGLLGITIDGVTSATARALGLPKPKGVLVTGVREGYPAEKTGLKQGDVILTVDGQEVNAPNELQMLIARNYPGAKVNLLIYREGQEKNIEVVLAEAPRPENTPALSSGDGRLDFENLGMVVRELKREEKEMLDGRHGVMVERVYAGSPAHNAGIYKADIIVAIDESNISSKNDFEKRLRRAASGDILRLQVMRIGNDDVLNEIVFVEVP